MYRLFNKELLYRILSVIVFIPLVILPIIYSKYISVFIYLIFTSIILIEIDDMKTKVSKKNIFNFYIAIVIISFFIFLFLLLNEIFPYEILVYLIVIIWLFDTFSFIGGKIIGGRKLMPKISKGKTFAGLFTGIFVTLLINEMAVYILEFQLKLSILTILMIMLLSFIGDILVSLLKRHASIKDSGFIMPGHGGLLDRLDSFIMVFFVFGISVLIV